MMTATTTAAMVGQAKKNVTMRFGQTVETTCTIWALNMVPGAPLRMLALNALISSVKNSRIISISVLLLRCVLAAFGFIFLIATAFSGDITESSGYGDLIASSLSAFLAASLFGELDTQKKQLFFSMLCLVGTASIAVRAYDYYSDEMVPGSYFPWGSELLFFAVFALVFFGRMRNVLMR